VPAAAVIREVLVLFFMTGRIGYVDGNFGLKSNQYIARIDLFKQFYSSLMEGSGTFNPEFKCVDLTEHQKRRRLSISN